MSLTASDNSKDMTKDNDYNLRTTDTNMMIPLIANDIKLVSDEQRWNWSKEEKEPHVDHNNQDNNNYNNYNGYGNNNNIELDDNFGNYLTNNNLTNNTYNEPFVSKNDTVNKSYDDYNDNNDNVFEKKKNSVDHLTDDYDKSKYQEINNNNTNNTNNNTNNINAPNLSNSIFEKPMSTEELMLAKLDMLRKLAELKAAGVTLSQIYNMNSDLNMMKYEYELHKNIKAKQNGINWMSSMTLNMIYGIEMLNDKYNPFDLKLKGWSEQINADVNSYYDVFGELYEKYNQPGKNMAPEVKLLLMVSGSALKFHLQSSLMSRTSTLNDYALDNPKIEEYRQKAIGDKLRDQAIKNNHTLNEIVSKEHAVVAEKAKDLQLLKEKELEYLDMQKKQMELEELKKKLSLQNQPVNYNQGPDINKAVNPSVQKMMNIMASNNNTNNGANNGANLNNNNSNMNTNNYNNQSTYNDNSQLIKQQMEYNKRIGDEQIKLLETQREALKRKIEMEQIQQLSQMNQMNQMNQMKQFRSEEEKMRKSEASINKSNISIKNNNSNKYRQETDNISMSSSKSEITLHDVSEVFSRSKDNLEFSDTHKITQIDTVDEDDITNGMSLGGSRKSRSTHSKTSSRMGKKKKGLVMDF